LKLEEMQRAISNEEVDGWLFFDHHRRDPLAYRILRLPENLMPTRRWYYLIPAKGDPIALVSRIEPHVLDDLPGEKRHYSQWAEQIEQLSGMLSSYRSVAMQYSPQCSVPYIAMVDAGTLELVRGTGVDVRGSANLVQLFEARWSDDQLQSHLEAGKRMDTIRREAFALISDRVRSRASVSEWDIHGFLREAFARNGLITNHGPIVAVNDNASNPHYEPEEDNYREIKSGDLVLIDMWAKLAAPESVYYDITWTGYCGNAPPDPILNVFEAVTGARDEAVQFLEQSIDDRRTVCGYEVDNVARSYISTRGYGQYFIHRTGHSIGTEVHGAGANMDDFETHDDRRILPRTCFSVEPGVYLPEFGIRSEVNVYIDSTVRVTGDIQDKLVILG
jgi:Xaa-Pro dipeptidase